MVLLIGMVAPPACWAIIVPVRVVGKLAIANAGMSGVALRQLIPIIWARWTSFFTTWISFSKSILQWVVALLIGVPVVKVVGDPMLLGRTSFVHLLVSDCKVEVSNRWYTELLGPCGRPQLLIA